MYNNSRWSPTYNSIGGLIVENLLMVYGAAFKDQRLKNIFFRCFQDVFP